MKKIAVIGHFGFGKNLLNGQTIKTKVLTEALKEQLGTENVSCVDTHGGVKTLVKIVARIFSVLKKHDDIIMLPAYNGVLIFTPLLSFFNKFAKKNLHYVVIGGWLPEYLDKHKFTGKLLKKNFKGIYVETTVMKDALIERNFENIRILPNYKSVDPVSETELSLADGYPVRACSFSRVTEKKGVLDAIKVVTEINNEIGETAIVLDIYGAIENGFEEEFNSAVENSPDCICYKGTVDHDNTVQALKEYDLQLFPTKFKTEGIPGSVVESFFAGTPVVSSKWNSFADVIDDGVTGIGFEIENYYDFKDKLQKLISNHELLNSMKKNCLKRAESYKQESIETLKRCFID